MMLHTYTLQISKKIKEWHLEQDNIHLEVAHRHKVIQI